VFQFCDIDYSSSDHFYDSTTRLTTMLVCRCILFCALYSGISGIFSTVGIFCYRVPAISLLGEIAAGGPFKHWELEDSEARLKVDLDVYSSSLSASECYFGH